MQSRFPKLGAHLIEDHFDEVCEAAATPLGQPNAWPGDAPLEGFLRWRLERRLLNHIERRAARHENIEDVAAVLVTETADPASIVSARDQAAIFARHLAELPEDAQHYVADLQAGLKRAEIVEARGWGPKKLKLLRKRIQTAVLDAREAAAAALFPFPLATARRTLAKLSLQDPGGTGSLGVSSASVKVVIGIALASSAVGMGSAVRPRGETQHHTEQHVAPRQHGPLPTTTAMDIPRRPAVVVRQAPVPRQKRRYKSAVRARIHSASGVRMKTAAQPTPVSTYTSTHVSTPATPTPVPTTLTTSQPQAPAPTTTVAARSAPPPSSGGSHVAGQDEFALP
jgi:hypothetical protein